MVCHAIDNTKWLKMNKKVTPMQKPWWILPLFFSPAEVDLCEVTGHPKYLQHQPQESYATNFLKPREKYVLIQMESKLCCIVLPLRAYIFYVNVRETDQVFAEKELVVFVLVILLPKIVVVVSQTRNSRKSTLLSKLDVLLGYGTFVDYHWNPCK